MDIGEAIKFLRKKQGISQMNLAFACGMSQTFLSQVEKNKKQASMKNLKLIAEKIDIPLPYLIFKSITLDDIPADKKPVFQLLCPMVDSLFNT